MSLIHVFGSRAGTEPMLARHHVSWALEHNKEFYWFDAGENCSHTAHLMGLDLTRIRNIFISHPHMDHVGGLPNLLWTIRKLTTVRKIENLPPLNIHSPSLRQLDAIITLLSDTEGNFKCCFDIVRKSIADGFLLDNGAIIVEARHNLHLGIPEDGKWQSFSFRVQVNGKKLVYSGDVHGIEDLEDWLDCDLLIMESGHHSPIKICSQLRENHAPVKQIMWIHHGRELLNHPIETRQSAETAWGDKLIFAEDGMTIEF